MIIRVTSWLGLLEINKITNSFSLSNSSNKNLYKISLFKRRTIRILRARIIKVIITSVTS